MKLLAATLFIFTAGGPNDRLMPPSIKEYTTMEACERIKKEIIAKINDEHGLSTGVFPICVGESLK